MKTEADLVQPTSSGPALVKSDAQVFLESLRAENEELQRRKTDAEKDRELFRELYNKASLHASSVTKENNELQERVSIAEGQVRDGLAMIRQTYEVQVKALKDEVARLQGLNAILNARDLKMQGDDIRRRAGEEADLKVENQRLRAQFAEMRLDYHRMERLLEQVGTHELGGQEPALQNAAGQLPVPASTQITIAKKSTEG